MSIDLTGADDDVRRELRYLVSSARHDLRVETELRYAVTSTHDGQLIVENDVDLGRVETPADVLALIYERVHTAAFRAASSGGWVRIHAAVIDIPAGRAIIVGAAGSGKTTLACQLLSDGRPVGCDESVVTRDGVGIPVGRRFHLKPDLEDLVPAMEGRTDDLPAIDGRAVRAFDPGEAGLDWHIEARPIDDVVLLSRHVSPTGLTAASPIDIMPAVVAQAFPHGEPAAQRIAGIAAVLRRARCWRLGPTAVDVAAASICRLPPAASGSSLLRAS